MSKPYLIFTSAHEKGKNVKRSLTVVNGIDGSTLLICEFTNETYEKPDEIASCSPSCGYKMKKD
jgi:hypothetical protein